MKLQFDQDHMDFIRKCIAERDAVLAEKPDDIEAKYNKALMLLSIGEFTEGWPLFDIRTELPNAIHKYSWFPVPRWDGSDISGKHVMLWLEQGIGDQIMAMSMLGRLAEKAASVVLLADRRFYDIVKRSFPANVQMHRVGDHIPSRLRKWDFDCQISMSDMGQMFLRTGDDFNNKPYIKPDPALVEHFRRKYNKRPDRKLIGFSWMSANAQCGALKSIPPAIFERLLHFGGADFVSLQYGDNQDDLREFRKMGCDFVNDNDVDPLVSLEESAAQIAAMDMVVSVSNSTVHMAGAMGVKTLVLVPVGHGRAWYWFTGYNQAPWYDSVTVCRADDTEDWSDAINKAYGILSQETPIRISI